MNENDSGPAASSGEGFKTIISMSLVAVVDGALCFVNQSQFVRLSVAGGRISSRGSSSGVLRRLDDGSVRAEGEPGERDKARRWNIKRETERDNLEREREREREAGGRSKSKGSPSKKKRDGERRGRKERGRGGSRGA